MTNIYAHLADGDAPKNQHITEVSFVDENGKHVDISGGMDEGDIILFIGDSIVYGYGASNKAHRFSTLLANKLGLTEVNHSSPGAGFVHISTLDNKTLMDCVNEAIEDDTFDHSKVKYLILEGGINDNNAGDIANAANAIMSKLRDEFASARRYFMNTLTAGGKTTKAQSYTNVGASGPFVGSIGVVGMYNIISTAQTAAYTNMFTPLDCWNWLSFENGFDGDGVHPNDAGHERIAAMMYGSSEMESCRRNAATYQPRQCLLLTRFNPLLTRILLIFQLKIMVPR